MPLPAVATVLEGGVEPRYPTISGRMKAKKVKIETVEPRQAPGGPHRLKLTLPPAQPSTVEVLGEGTGAATAVVDLLQKPGGGPMILVLVETDAHGAAEPSLETITFARDLVTRDAGELAGQPSTRSWSATCRPALSTSSARTGSARCTTPPATRSPPTAARPGPPPSRRPSAAPAPSR